MASTRIVLAIAVAFVAAVGFYPALRIERSPRIGALVILSCVAMFVPLLVPPQLAVVRFSVAVFASLMVFKMWDLHVGANNGSRPDFREFVGFMANPCFLVWRKRGAENQPSTRRNILDLFLGVVGLAILPRALGLLDKIDWSTYPFLLDHLVMATGLFVLGTVLLNTSVAITRLFGGYIIRANDRPLAARTPAEFWRRYNRLIGQFLHEDFFKPMQGRRHPLRTTLAIFAVSGLVHEYLFWMMIGRSAGLQLLFFMLQGSAVALTLRIKPVGWQAIAWGAGTFVFNILASVFFFASIHHALPIYQHGLPAWLEAW